MGPMRRQLQIHLQHPSSFVPLPYPSTQSGPLFSPVLLFGESHNALTQFYEEEPC